eukprot:GGOE01039496.1.p2 GENE.GGOE01039496.1~~GGOE01039496.1.p2  ORF type:complete len:100 (-),score=8.48 GGOE01039496.1:9-272(-)
MTEGPLPKQLENADSKAPILDLVAHLDDLALSPEELQEENGEVKAKGPESLSSSSSSEEEENDGPQSECFRCQRVESASIPVVPFPK